MIKRPDWLYDKIVISARLNYSSGFRLISTNMKVAFWQAFA